MGLGRSLIGRAEQRAKDHGCEKMRLELLTPRDWEHPVKKFLDEWYQRIGYVKGDEANFEDQYAHRVNDLACPCKFTVYLK